MYQKSPLQSAEDVVAENIKCTLKVSLFILHFSEVFTTQPTLVLAETDLCRAVSITKKEEPRFSLNEDVLPKQNLMSLTTRKY